MSRWIQKDEDGSITQGIVGMDECRYLVDEVCCNDRSEQCCDFPHPDYCKTRCPHFTEEDGVIENSKVH